MSVLLLRLAGPLQAWGDASRFTRRDTRSVPTKSGVLGLLAAAQGRRRTDDLEDLVKLRFGLRVDQPGQLTRDFQTAKNWSTGKAMPLSVRYYLADAVFVAGVEGEGDLLHALDDALTRPTFPLYLGRRSCPVSGRVSLGVVDMSLEDALRSAQWEASRWYRRSRGQQVALRLIVDAEEGAIVTETARDVPLSFNPERREYGWREVTELAPVVVDNPEGRASAPDWIAAVGGL